MAAQTSRTRCDRKGAGGRSALSFRAAIAHGRGMSKSLTDTLCTRCGLCCDGTLFADVELSGRAEPRRLELLGLEIDEADDGGALLVQPCAALRGTRCSVYAHRPECCRTFECRLLMRARRGEVGVDAALSRIAETRALVRKARRLLARLGHADAELPLLESCAEAMAEAPATGAAATRARAELAKTTAALERAVRGEFLGEG
jgi:uncharacterized protein